MLDNIKKIANIFLNEIQDKEILIISHHDTDGITSAAILASCLKDLDKEFSIRIVKQLEQEMIEEFPEEKIIVLLDLGSGNINKLKQIKERLFIIDHHEINQAEIDKDMRIINPHINGKENLTASCLTYLFSKELKHNKSLANLAILGIIGDMHDKNIGKIGNNIINDAEIQIKKGPLLYPSTRPLDKALEFSSSMFIPGVTGSYSGAVNLLKEAEISKKDGKFKSIVELNKEEMSKLITSILLRTNKEDSSELVGNIYLIKFFNKLTDAREISAMINACSRLEHSHIALSLCLGSRKAKKQAERIYVKYKRHIVDALKYVSDIKKIQGDDYVIINAKDNIKDTIIGTIASIISSSTIYKKGDIIITMAHNESKIKISGRISGRNGRNIKELLESVINEIGGEVGGHHLAAGCLIEKDKEQDFIETLKKKLDVELVKV
jgi:RecJ-like exonuclease